MSLWLLLKLIFLFLYVGLSALITFLIYREETPFYTPIYVKKKSEKEGEKETTVNLHDEFDVYTKRDEPLNVIKLFIGMLTIFWPKFIIAVILSYGFSVNIYNRSKKKNFKLSKEDIDSNVNGAKFWTKLFVKVCGGFVDFKRLPEEKVLPVCKKYFGKC